ncbi:MAG: hypothetical protein RL497_1569, partial [Pseudomonadota bacterium]
CTTTLEGEFKTPNNEALTLVNGKKSVVAAPGPLTLKMGDLFSNIYFEIPKNNKVKIPFSRSAFDPNKIKQFQLEGISHCAHHKEIFIADIGAPYSDQYETTCSKRGNCSKSEPAVNCSGAIYGEHSNSSSYQKYKDDSGCSKTTNSYYAQNVTCSGEKTVYTTKQKYSAYDLLDFFNTATNMPEAYFDSKTTERTKELSSREGECRISG